MRLLVLAGAAGILLSGAALILRTEPPDAVTMIVVGDIMLSRNVAARMQAAQDPLLPFRNVSALLSSSDFNFGNLESPFAAPEEGGDEPGPMWDGIIGGTSLVFAAPDRTVQALSRYGFRIVTLANNHALDQGQAGLAYTLKHLAGNGIQAVGAGGDLQQAWQGRIVEAKGKRIGFLAASYASVNDGGRKKNELVARIEDLDGLAFRIHSLKSQADFVVVSMHAGTEYTAGPDPSQVRFAHAAIDAGAKVVVGSHPHWIQRLERYRAGLIFYSLGNFVFDLNSSPETRRGLAVKLTVIPNGPTSAELHPVQIENLCCPREATPAESVDVLRRMQAGSTRVPLN